MNAQQRRDYILERLKAAAQPGICHRTSRRAGGEPPDHRGGCGPAPGRGRGDYRYPRGYMARRPAGLVRQAAVQHRPEEMERELNAIVDQGCTVLDVVVEHPVYGQITGRLDLSSRYEVSEFIRRVNQSRSHPLSDLTDGIHLHTVSCPDEGAWRRVLAALEREGFLLS